LAAAQASYQHVDDRAQGINFFRCKVKHFAKLSSNAVCFPNLSCGFAAHTPSIPSDMLEPHRTMKHVLALHAIYMRGVCGSYFFINVWRTCSWTAKRIMQSETDFKD